MVNLWGLVLTPSLLQLLVIIGKPFIFLEMFSLEPQMVFSCRFFWEINPLAACLQSNYLVILHTAFQFSLMLWFLFAIVSGIYYFCFDRQICLTSYLFISICRFDGDGCVPLIHGSSLGITCLNLHFSKNLPLQIA